MSEFKEIINPWSEYELPDGRRCRVRHVLTECKQTGIDDNGVAIFQMSFAGICVMEEAPTMTMGWPLLESGLGNRVALGPNPSRKKTDIQ